MGLAVPISQSLRDETLRRIEFFGETLRRSQEAEGDPPMPRERRRCQMCRLGKPLLLIDKDIEQHRKARLPLLVLASPQGKRYHCLCGDRFGAAPPHARSLKLGLATLLE
jgi:hypothetical protein